MAASEEQVLAGLLTVTVGGMEKSMPTLPIRDAREWRKRLAAEVAPIAGLQIDANDWADMPAKLQLAEDTMLDLIVAYDRTSALGGREWLEEHAWPRELGPIFTACVEAVFPFDRRAGVPGGPAVAPSPGPSSTSGPSPTGASTRSPLRGASTDGS
jgi:hypothetical protein